MSRLIDANNIRYEPMLSARGNGKYEEVMIAYKDEIDDMPTVEERKGKWIAHPDDFDEWYRCSVCHKGLTMFDGTYNFCPNCGADMRGD